VIEDDEAIRDTLRMLLEEAGYPVVEAVDGLAGYRLLKETDRRFIALVDHKMPKMDGCDLLERMEQDETLRARHIYIMLSASPTHAEDDCGETLKELAAPLVSKPFSIDEVLDAVADAAQRLGATSSITMSKTMASLEQVKTKPRTPQL
jgi:CheY-like chemotaxis protein